MSKLDDITEKIEALLSDEESMNQIKELAAMFSGSMNGGTNGASGANAAGNMQGSFSPGTDNPAGNDTAGDNESAGADTKSAGGIGINPLAVMQLLGAASDDKDCGLLLALRPHLSSEKQRRLDKAVKLLKLYNIFITLRENGMLNDLENLL